ncbi:hypothetical protein GIB67_021907 [Kingdonia uniflora]|uniref:MATH domain-containing protein n=1 Tax=Kingdonia uniflora TaxID=39325 RepID=A0A7J7L191_9MAGN|nr:hypothetical protein GIB67_021907 [Kingdonia uniflora]
MTADFESGGYKWKLSLYPNGNPNKNGKDHISLYLVISDTSSLHFGWEVNVILRLFLFDQIRDKYLVIEDCRGGFSRFHELKTECGFSRFVSRETFYDPHNGFLVDDNCAFGVELFVRKSTVTVRGESLSMLRKATTIKHSWKVENFIQITDQFRTSEEFTAGDQKWKLKLYPKGIREERNKSISLYLQLADPSLGQEVYANYKLRVKNQIHSSEHLERILTHRFNPMAEDWGLANFMGLEELKDERKDFLKNDTCIIEADVTVLGIVQKYQ